jgi:hypothetical protein
MDLIGWLVIRPPIPQLGLDLFFTSPSVSCGEAFYCFLGDPWAKHLEVLFLGFYYQRSALGGDLQSLELQSLRRSSPDVG